MRVLIFLLTLSVFSCSGFPAYDYELPVMEEALNASIARINSQSWGRNLYGVVRSHVTGVDMWNSDAYRLELQFSIRETVCSKASGRDPFTCHFKAGPYVASEKDVEVFSYLKQALYSQQPTASCRSVVEVSGEQVSSVIVRCHRGTFSSESLSSEEMMYVPKMTPSWRGSGRREDVFAPEAFPSGGRGGSRGDWHTPTSDRME